VKSFFKNFKLPKYIINETPLILLGTFSVKVAKFFIFLYAAKLLGPELWGEWNILMLVLMYISHYHLGFINAYNREAPIYIDNPKIFNSIKKNINTLVLSLLFTSSIILFFAQWFNNNFSISTIFLFNIYFFSSSLVQLIETFYKVKIRFDIVAYYQIAKSFLLLISSYFLITEYEINGLLLSLIISEILIILLNFKLFKGIFFKPKFAFIKKYLNIGFPIMLVGFTFMLIHTIDRLVIIHFFGNSELGIYSLGALVFQILIVFPQMISMQFYPRMIRQYHNDGVPIKKIYNQQLLILSLITLPIMLIAFFIIPIIIKIYLVEYSESINITLILILAVSMLPTTFISGIVFNILNMQKKYLFLQLIAISFNFLLSIYFILLGYGIFGVAIATFLSFMIYSIILTLYLNRYVFK
tara:strand:- start:1515 stop:2753 length:1239 start_codon:yes stop_codon:yes gene_type:complete